MKYLGDYAEDYATLNFKFSTHKADGTPITLAGTPAVSVYKANGTTQSTAGVTISVDFDGVTGLHNVLIDLSADAFYAVANDYAVVITTGTVDSVSVVGTVLAHFSIANRTAAPTVAVIADGVWDEARSGHTTAGSFGEVSTAADVADAVWDEALAGHATAGTAGATASAILEDTGTTLDGRIPAALVSGRMDSSVGAMGAGVLDAAAIAADAITAAKLAADVATEIQTGLAMASAITALDSKIGTPAGASVSADIAALPTAVENADATMTRASSNWEASAPLMSLGTAIMKATHKIAPTGADLVIYRSDGTTAHAKQTLTTDATLEPIKEVGASTTP
jgi:hypothetical protein